MKKGTSLDELWKVARGEVKYKDFLERSQGKKQKTQPNRSSVEVPDDLASPPSVSSTCRCSDQLLCCHMEDLLHMQKGKFLQALNAKSMYTPHASQQ